MNSRFQKFENTNLYKEFGDILTVEPELVLAEEYDYYNDTLTYLRTTFGCITVPSMDNIQMYISNNEDIETNQIEDFTTFIKTLFRHFILVTKSCSKIRTKSILASRREQKKEIVTENRKQERQAIKDERDRLRQLRDESKANLKAYNSEIVRCKCGLDYIRSTKANHTLSTPHRYRMAGIEYYKSRPIDDIVDTDSAITDDDSSFDG